MKITALLVLKVNPTTGDSDPVILANATDVSHFGFFQRSTVKELVVFFGRTVAKRTQPSQRQSVQHEEYKVHSYNRDGLCAVAFMDDNYPVRSAFSLLNQVLDEYQKNFGDSWKTTQADSTQAWPYLNDALIKFQDPAQADKLLKIQRELDETKIILEQVYVLEPLQKLAASVKQLHDDLCALRATQLTVGKLMAILDERDRRLYATFGLELPTLPILSTPTTTNFPHKTIDSVLERGEKLDNLVSKSSDLSAASQMFYKQAKKTNQCCTIL